MTEYPLPFEYKEEMLIDRDYRSKENGRVYRCFYKSEYEFNTYSIQPLDPTEEEKHIFPFPHWRIEFNPNDWELLPENWKPEDLPATVDKIELGGDVYVITNKPL